MPNSQSEQLCSGFPQWNPIERAKALAEAKQDGLMNRALAEIVGVSEGSVRNYLLLLDLPIADQAAIMAGAAVRPYVRRIREKKKRRSEAIARKKAAESESAAANAVREIQSWFRDQSVGWGLAEQILLEAQALIRLGQQQGVIKSSPIAWDGPVARQFAAARPGDIDALRGIERINALVNWLARALVRLLPDIETRDAAIYAALGRPTELGIG